MTFGKLGIILKEVKQKKLVIILAGVGVFLLLGLGGFFLYRQSTSADLEPEGEGEEASAQVEMKEWQDPAGFRFEYPENLVLDPHEEDEENYAHLELTSNEFPGRILIWMKETTFKTISDWVKGGLEEGVQVLDTELGGEPAKKAAFTDPEKLVVAVLDVDVLVLIEMEPGGEGENREVSVKGWQTVNDQILDSFEFIPLEGEEAASAPQAGSAGPVIIEEPEEVIE